MKERPILFSGPMVRAVLDGRKSQTRRVVTDRHLTRLGLEIHDGIAFTLEGGQWNGMFESGSPPWCPYGIPGDRLWVRECWRFGYPVHSNGPSLNVKTLQYRADYGDDANFIPWKPSIHMKRQDSRITLEVVAVRVERLQEINEEDATAEGIHQFGALEMYGYDPRGTPGTMIGGTATEAFSLLWRQINGPESWSANPWVWVVEFKRLEQPK